MTKGDNFSTDQMAAALDNAPVAVMVSALDDWKLLYANRPARELISKTSGGREGTCYNAAGFDDPCPHCPAGKISRAGLYEREVYWEKNDRTYQLSGKIIDWGDRPAHIEYILDITERKREEDQSRIVKEKLKETFNSVPRGLCVYRFENGKITPIFQNPALFLR